MKNVKGARNPLLGRKDVEQKIEKAIKALFWLKNESFYYWHTDLGKNSSSSGGTTITQKEALDIYRNWPHPRWSSDTVYKKYPKIYHWNLWIFAPFSKVGPTQQLISIKYSPIFLAFSINLVTLF